MSNRTRAWLAGALATVWLALFAFPAQAVMFPDLLSQVKSIQDSPTTRTLGPPLGVDQIRQDYTTVYRVKRDETLATISRKFGVEEGLVSAVNDFTRRTKICEGQYMLIPSVSVSHLVHTVAKGETLSGISKNYGVALKDVIAVNGIQRPNYLSIGQKVIIPRGEGVQTAALQDRRLASRSLTGGFSWPVMGVITSLFGPRNGQFHYGLDIAAETGRPVRALLAGKVVERGWKGTYGMVVVIDHGRHLQTLYAHNSKLKVKEGQWVEAGQIVAEVGSTGRSTGPHVHLEIIRSGQRLNPWGFLRKT